MGALRDQEATDEISSIISARDLVMRSILIWIAVLALLTLGGWLG
jgi:membrane protein required for beta-lactamase induction